MNKKFNLLGSALLAIGVVLLALDIMYIFSLVLLLASIITFSLQLIPLVEKKSLKIVLTGIEVVIVLVITFFVFDNII